MRWVLFGAAMVNFVVFARAIRSFFVRPPRLPRGMVRLSWAGACAGIVHLSAIARAPSIPSGMGAISFGAYLLSFGLFLWACRTVRVDRLPIAFSDPLLSPAGIVRTGPFALMRHPFYSSYSLTWIAGCVAAPQWPVLVVSVVMLCAYWIMACREEWWLLTHDDTGTYSAYLTTTPRFLPRLLRGRSIHRGA